jgi:hypothetical protein
MSLNRNLHFPLGHPKIPTFRNISDRSGRWNEQWHDPSSSFLKQTTYTLSSPQGLSQRTAMVQGVTLKHEIPPQPPFSRGRHEGSHIKAGSRHPEKLTKKPDSHIRMMTFRGFYRRSSRIQVSFPQGWYIPLSRNEIALSI